MAKTTNSIGRPLLNINTSQVGNVDAGEDNLMTFTVPGGSLGTNGDSVKFEAAGTFAATVANKRIRAYFGSTVLFDTGVLALTLAGDWTMTGRIIRTGSGTEVAIVRINTSQTAMLAFATYTAPTETLSGDLVLKVTAEATNTNDIVQKLMVVEFDAAIS